MLQHHAAAAIDGYLLPAGPTAANPPQLRAATDRTDGQTDGRTPYSYIDPAPHTTRAVPITASCLVSCLHTCFGPHRAHWTIAGYCYIRRSVVSPRVRVNWSTSASHNPRRPTTIALHSIASAQHLFQLDVINCSLVKYSSAIDARTRQTLSRW